MRKSIKLCRGCRNNFYNGNNPFDVKECWSFATATVKTRFRIGIDTPMDRASNFVKTQKFSCYHESGYVYLDALPSHLVPLTRKSRSRA